VLYRKLHVLASKSIKCPFSLNRSDLPCSLVRSLLVIFAKFSLIDKRLLELSAESVYWQH